MSGMCFSELPTLKKNSIEYKNDVDKLVQMSEPDLEQEINSDFFRLFGYHVDYNWIQTKDWKELPEKLKWKYVALCSLNWLEHYKYWLEKEKYHEYKKNLVEWSKKNPEFLETLKYLETLEKEAKVEF